MATRSTIAMVREDGTVAQVYCHWDGYLDNNGRILVNHYMDPAKVAQLIALGSISSLGEEIGEKHLFDNPHTYGTAEYNAWQVEHDKITTFYGRDRGEEDVGPRIFKDVADYENYYEPEEYNYLFIEGRWYYKSYDELVRDVEKQLAYELLKKVA